MAIITKILRNKFDDAWSQRDAEGEKDISSHLIASPRLCCLAWQRMQRQKLDLKSSEEKDKSQF